jgi:hypothetical protein
MNRSSNAADAPGYEPTLHDVMGALMTVNEKVDHIDSRLGTIERSVSSLEGRVSGVERSLGRLEVKVADMQEDLTSALTALDRDAVTLVGHEKRIRVLEKARA